jgi:hypothetical protein
VALEDVLIGNRRVGDVPGFEIPQRYFDFVRSGDPAPLEPVLEHNRLDLLSTALLFGRAQQLVQQGPAGASDAYECLSLARLHERCGAVALADEAYRAALEHPLADRTARERAWYGLAILQRRRRRHEDAAASWRELLLVVDRRSRSLPGHRALAIYHEHRAEPGTARPSQGAGRRARSEEAQALEHWLARLDASLSWPGDQALADTVTTPLPWGE